MISIVDDDAFAREGICVLLQSFGYDVMGFASAEQFLASTALHEATCLVTDINMPGVSGLELQRRLGDRGCRIPIILITAYPDEQQKRRALAAGAAGFLTKPFSEQSLLDCLAAALGTSHGDAKRSDAKRDGNSGD